MDDRPLTNGTGGAAILAAGIGALALGVFAFAGDAVHWIGRAFSIWPPSGALSGVTTAAIAVWLGSWYWLARRWRGRTVALAWVNSAAFVMLLTGLLLTFPPFMDFLQGK